MYPQLQDWHQEFISLRHHFHAHPELAFQEHETAKKIHEQLTAYGVDAIETGWATTGIVATIHGKDGAANDPDRVIALRADIDALPIVEQTGLPYASKTHGKMHACGHDGHITGLLMAAKYLATHRHFSGSVKLIFQPAEEDGGGGDVMVREGLFTKHPAKSVWGMHNWPRIPLGVILAKPGPMMAACDEFNITVTGQGGHAAYPHKVNDPLIAAAQLVLALQTIVSRNVEPVSEGVVSVTALNIGNTYNVIDDKAFMKGTIRSYAPEIRALMHQRAREICTGIATAFGVRIEFDLMEGYPATINTTHEAHLAAEVAASITPHVVTDFKPVMGAEDFAYMLQEVPGCYIGLGTGKTDNDPGLHDAEFDYNDDALPLAASYWIALVEKLLPAA